MLLRSFLNTAALAVVASLSAQTPTVSWGRVFDEKEDGEFRMVMDTKDDAAYLWVQRKGKDLIGKLDPDLSLAYLKEFDEGMEKDERRFVRILPMGDRFIVLTDKYDKKKDAHVLYGRLYAEADYTPLTALRVVTEMEVWQSTDQGSFAAYLTPDRKAIAIHMKVPQKKNGGYATRTLYLDEDLNEVTWEATTTRHAQASEPVTARGGILSESYHTAKGDELRVMKRPARKEDERDVALLEARTLPALTLLLSHDGGEWEEHPMPLLAEYVQLVTFAEYANGDILCSGLYGQADGAGVTGVFSYRLRPSDLNVLLEDRMDFSASVIEEGMSDQELHKMQRKADRDGKQVEMPAFRLDDPMGLEDGGHIAVAESGRTWEYCSADASGRRFCYTIQELNDLLVVGVGPDGKIRYAMKVPKRQHTEGRRNNQYAGYRLHTAGNTAYVMYNDVLDNLEIKEGRRLKTMEEPEKGCGTVIVSISPEGTLRKAPLFNGTNGMMLRPGFCMDLSGNRLLVCAQHGDSYRFGILSFE